MSELTVANRYAKSLIDLAVENKVLDEVRRDMDFFIRTLRANPELQAVLANPIIAHAKKVKILEAIFGANVNRITTAFFNIMINKSRAEILYGAAREFVNQYNEIRHIVRASVVSATPLSGENEKQIIAELQAATGGTIELKKRVDPDLIGGFILTVGDRQLDTSISSSLQRLKTEFARGVNR